MKKRFVKIATVLSMTAMVGLMSGCSTQSQIQTQPTSQETTEIVTEAPTESPKPTEGTENPEVSEEFEPIFVTVSANTGFTVYEESGESITVKEKDCCCGGDSCCCGGDSCSCDSNTEDDTASVMESENGLLTASVYEQTEDYTVYEITVNGWTDDSRISIGTENFATEGILSVKCAYGEVETCDFEFANVQIADGKIEWIELPEFICNDRLETVIENERPADK